MLRLGDSTGDVKMGVSTTLGDRAATGTSMAAAAGALISNSVVC